MIFAWRCAAAAEKAAVGVHVQHLEKVSNDLEKLYQQTAELNALKREIVEKDECVVELEELIKDQFAASSQQAASLEALCELATRLDLIVKKCLLGFEELKDASSLAQMEEIKATRAWQAERLERASVFQALKMLLVREEDGEDMQMGADELSAEDVHRLLSQIMGDRYEVVSQLEEAQSAIDQKELQLRALSQECTNKERLRADAEAQIAQLEVSAEMLRQKHEAELRSSQEEVQSLVAWTTVEQSRLNESSAAERAELQDIVEERTARVAAWEERATAAEMACQLIQKERDEAVADAEAAQEANAKMLAELKAEIQQKTALAADLSEKQIQLQDAQLKLENLQRDLTEQSAALDDVQTVTALASALQLQVERLQDDLAAAKIGLEKADELEREIADLQIVKAALQREQETRRRCERDLEEGSAALNKEIKLKEQEQATRKRCQQDLAELSAALDREVELKEGLLQATSAAGTRDDAAQAVEIEAQVNRLEKELTVMKMVVEQLKTNEGALTARSVEAETKLAEAERTMLACMAEEARLLDEIEAGEHRNGMLEQRLKTLQGIRDPIHVPGGGATSE